ncbi:MAG: hypothetical protein A2029_02735 [Chloroflexi bacterium RBG_19FT_COMBO_47_9]|nr:MAG: hypothetical protein A2029_02735 [Chloroflexi bacterium RBG_19FT_COMBO_47_9]
MPKTKVTGQILTKINEYADNPDVYKFIVKLCYEEADHPGQWRWKEEYMKILDDCTPKNRSEDEDK